MKLVSHLYVCRGARCLIIYRRTPIKKKEGNLTKQESKAHTVKNSESEIKFNEIQLIYAD